MPVVAQVNILVDDIVHRLGKVNIGILVLGALAKQGNGGAKITGGRVGSDAEDGHIVVATAYLLNHLDIGIHVIVGLRDCRGREVVGAKVDHHDVGTTPLEIKLGGGKLVVNLCAAG